MRVLLVALLCATAIALFVVMLLENGYGNIWALSFSPDGRQLMAAYNNETAQVWNISEEQTQPLPMTLASDNTHWVLPSSPQFGGPRLLVAFRISRVEDTPDGYELWDTAAGHYLCTLQLPYRADVFQVSKKGHVILASSRTSPHTLDLFDIESGRHIGTLAESESGPGRLREQCIMSADGKRVAASYDGDNGNSMLKVWNTENCQCIKSLVIESGYGLNISQDGRLLLANSDRDIWNLESGDKVTSIEAGKNAHCTGAFSIDGSMLALGSYYGRKTEVWDVTDGHLLAELAVASSLMDTSRCTYVAFSPNAKSLATATGRTVRLWDVTDFRLEQELARGYRGLAAVLFIATFILWSVAWSVLGERQKPQLGGCVSRRPHLVLPAAVLTGLTALIAIANSTLGVLHPLLWSCCTPTVMMLVSGYLAIGTGIFVLSRVIRRELQGAIPATLFVVLFTSLSNDPPLAIAALICGGLALLLQGIAAVKIRKETPASKTE